MCRPVIRICDVVGWPPTRSLECRCPACTSPPGRAKLAVPVTITVGVIAGAWYPPAWYPPTWPPRPEPVAAVRPPVLGFWLARQPSGITAFAVVNVLRTRGRALLDAIKLAVVIPARVGAEDQRLLSRMTWRGSRGRFEWRRPSAIASAGKCRLTAPRLSRSLSRRRSNIASGQPGRRSQDGPPTGSVGPVPPAPWAACLRCHSRAGVCHLRAHDELRADRGVDHRR